MAAEPGALRRSPFALACLVLALLVGAGQAAVSLARPLTPEWNDSAWYWMNVHFLRTGEYLFESAYPSFTGASQLYPVLGYSALLSLARAFESATGVDWTLALRLVQLALHLASAGLVARLVARAGAPRLAPLGALLFLLHHPSFLYAGFVMSETLATFLALAVLALAARWLAAGSRRALLACGLVLGQAILVKPIFLLLGPLLLAALAVRAWRDPERRGVRAVAAAAGLMLVLPLAQSLASLRLYGNPALRSGFGWNLWERVIVADRLVPERSPRLNEMRRTLKEHGTRLPLQASWWVVASRMSALGYSERETARFCADVAWAGIRAHPLAYALGTFRNAWVAATTVPEVHFLFPDRAGYARALSAWAAEPQHRPLTDELVAQPWPDGAWSSALLAANHAAAALLAPYTRAVHGVLPLASCLVGGAVLLLRRRRAGPHAPDAVALLLLAAPLALLVATNLAEKPLPRFALPAVPLLLAGTLVAWHLPWRAGRSGAGASGTGDEEATG